MVMESELMVVGDGVGGGGGDDEISLEIPLSGMEDRSI
jgi:hypothetical protein